MGGLRARCRRRIDDTLFLSTPLGRVIALDPVTGRQRWAFDARSPRDKGWGDYASRGVSPWRLVVGSAIADGTDKLHPSGEVRAFHAVTGKLLWSWDPVPQDPAAVGADSWKEGSGKRAGGANAWSVIVADVSRNLVFVPTSSPNHDYYGGERVGANLFSDSVVALRADTGHVFILDRQTGQPLIPVDESPGMWAAWRGAGWRTIAAWSVASCSDRVRVCRARLHPGGRWSP